MEKIKWHNEAEIMEIYNSKTASQKVKILEKAMEITGSKTHKIAVAMGYKYSDMYNESTWTK